MLEDVRVFCLTQSIELTEFGAQYTLRIQSKKQDTMRILSYSHVPGKPAQSPTDSHRQLLSPDDGIPHPPPAGKTSL